MLFFNGIFIIAEKKLCGKQTLIILPGFAHQDNLHKLTLLFLNNISFLISNVGYFTDIHYFMGQNLKIFKLLVNHKPYFKLLETNGL